MIIIIRLYFKRPLIVLRYFEVADYAGQSHHDKLLLQIYLSHSVHSVDDKRQEKNN